MTSKDNQGEAASVIRTEAERDALSILSNLLDAAEEAQRALDASDHLSWNEQVKLSKARNTAFDKFDIAILSHSRALIEVAKAAKRVDDMRQHGFGRYAHLAPHEDECALLEDVRKALAALVRTAPVETSGLTNEQTPKPTA